MSYKKLTETTMELKSDNTTMVDKIVAAIKAPMADDDELFNADEAMYIAAVWGVAGHVSGSLLARKRMANGDGPILKIFA